MDPLSVVSGTPWTHKRAALRNVDRLSPAYVNPRSCNAAGEIVAPKARVTLIPPRPPKFD
jgi:hypothetical protein